MLPESFANFSTNPQTLLEPVFQTIKEHFGSLDTEKLQSLLEHPAFQPLKQQLQSLDTEKLQALLTELFEKLKDTNFYAQNGEWLKNEAREHPVFIALMLFAVVLAMNPLALLGFGSLGPVAGSIAAAWQSSIGIVEAGSLFAFLQSLGMTAFGTTIIPAAGWAMGVGAAAKRWFWG